MAGRRPIAEVPTESASRSITWTIGLPKFQLADAFIVAMTDRQCRNFHLATRTEHPLAVLRCISGTIGKPSSGLIANAQASS